MPSILRSVPLDDPDLMRLAIRQCTGAGDALETIERRLIEPAELSDDQKSGLWLYAWAARTRGREQGELLGSVGMAPVGTRLRRWL